MTPLPENMMGPDMGMGQTSASTPLPGPAPQIGSPPTQEAPVEGAEGGLPDPTSSDKVGKILFEDFFPPLDVSDEQEKSLAEWFIRDLKSCVRHVNSMRDKWATWRAVYMLEYVDKFYPTLGMGAEFSSGELCEKVIEGMDRLRKSVLSPRPLFVVDDKTSNMEDIELIHRVEWFMHTLFTSDLKVKKILGLQAFFEFLLDGSFILGIDQMYEKIPQRTIRTYATVDELMMDEAKVVNRSDFDEALEVLEAGEMSRLLIEEDTLTKNGMQIFPIDKVDHLIPPRVYTDHELKFRARRMYLTKNDLRLLASDNVNWYDPLKVEAAIAKRNELRASYRGMRQGEGDNDSFAAERLTRESVGELAYDWRHEEDRLSADASTVPYEDTFTVYRIVCKYGYKTGGDEKGEIPKYCLFDFEPESRLILRPRTYPHFEERPDYFHFKLGHAPKSYWGFGFGARLINEDSLESNAVCLYMDGAALSTYHPMLTTHPEEGGYMPFIGGYGPGKIGYVKNPQTDVKWDEIPAPPMGLIQQIVPLAKTRAENRTGITSLTQGRTESSDPRSPAAKTGMLLREASISLDSIVEDWDTTGWEPLAAFVWMAAGEILVYEGKDAFENKIEFSGVAPDLEKVNVISAVELRKKIQWVSQASADFLNADLREQKFLKQFQFFAPQLQVLGQINPELFKKYFLRWMRWAAMEMNIRSFRYLIPTEEELARATPDQLMGAMSGTMEQLKTGQSPSRVEVQGGQDAKPRGQQPRPPSGR